MIAPIALWGALSLVVGCGSGSAPEEGPGRPGHAQGWDGLVAAAQRGDLVTAKVLARDLSLGDVSEDDPAAEKLGAALGFVQVAEDPEDLLDGVDKARDACVDCHARRGVPPPPAIAPPAPAVEPAPSEGAAPSPTVEPTPNAAPTPTVEPTPNAAPTPTVEPTPNAAPTPDAAPRAPSSAPPSRP